MRFDPRAPRFLRALALTSAASVLTLLASCRDPQMMNLPPPPPGDAAADVASDAANDGGAPADARRDVPLVDSGCPAPAAISSEMAMARGYLAPITVRFARPVDGDTAHFIFPVLGDQTVRFLFVNTEESHGDRTTMFGVQTASTVAEMLRAGREFSIVLQEHPRMPGQPNRDPYMRLLGLVFVDGDLFQTRLVREGWSAYYTEFNCAPAPAHNALVLAEAEARANERGIWAQGHPTDYRAVLQDWIGSNRCRPNPFRGDPYCR